MKTLLSSLLLALFLTSATAPAQADNGKGTPKHAKKARRTFAHDSESSKGKNAKVHYRRQSSRAFIDLNPKNPSKTKSVVAPPPYKYAKGF